jgi:hypothetical protein
MESERLRKGKQALAIKQAKVFRLSLFSLRYGQKAQENSKQKQENDSNLIAKAKEKRV